ncbi:MAG: hypothetical protein QF911_02385 [Candidatus Thalassarchaeaceae archaeon]|nr:hypothetical protein [Candidatus Thalassarchaeaceae archaeon]
MTKSAELLWLDAIEAEERGERGLAISLARDVVNIDESNTEAWMAIAQWTITDSSEGRRRMPELAQAAKAMSALRRVVSLDPGNARAWRLGGEILVEHLGMLEHALEWWEERLDFAPEDIVPLIEQLAILVRLGYFEECEERLDLLLSSNEGDDSDRKLERRKIRVKVVVERASRMEDDGAFAPQDQKDERWDIIRRMKNRKPISETFFLLTFVAPIVFLLGSAAMFAFGSSSFGSAAVFVLILASYFAISKVSMGLLNRLNRHAFDLDRALDVETTVGKVCISDEIRGSKLYNSILSKRSPAFKERLGQIVDSGERVPAKWELSTPF